MFAMYVPDFDSRKKKRVGQLYDMVTFYKLVLD